MTAVATGQCEKATGYPMLQSDLGLLNIFKVYGGTAHMGGGKSEDNFQESSGKVTKTLIELRSSNLIICAVGEGV